jgi:hypothetical protein
MHNYYVRFGRRHKFPSTVEILDELRSDLVPGYFRKSWAQHGFAKPVCASELEIPKPEPQAPAAMTLAESILVHSSPLEYPHFTTQDELVR